MSKTKEQSKKATEGKENEATVGTDQSTEKKQLSEQELRQLNVDNCSREVAQVLDKYNCEMTAQMIINEFACKPQVFIRTKSEASEESQVLEG